MRWIAKIFRMSILLALPVVGLLFLLWVDASPILFESLESKTNSGQPVFNRIRFHTETNKDVWLMEQSHDGVKAPLSQWDKIGINVNLEPKKRIAEFYQYKPGDEVISHHQKQIGLRATCFMCHSNGPRAIRPNLKSSKVQVSLWDQARIQLWNLRIKSYGPMASTAPVPSKKPFRYTHPVANRVLQVKACTRCHNSQDTFGRGELTKQNLFTIRFMLESKLMPPMGFELTQEDQRKIEEFLM